MQKLTIGEAAKLIPHSESKLRRDIRKGKVSATKENGKNLIDPAELERAYPGQLTIKETQTTGSADQKVVSLLEEQVQELRQALRQSTEREKELLDLLKNEQNRTLALTPPAPETKPSWWDRLTGRKGETQTAQ